MKTRREKNSTSDTRNSPRHKRLYPTFLSSVVLTAALLALLHATPPAAHAAPLPQTPDATLRIINDSEQTICFVQIASVTDTIWGPNRLASGAIIPSGGTYTFELEMGDYHIRLLDCDQNALLEEYYLPVTNLYDLRFTGSDLCKFLIKEGNSLYYQSHYEEALDKYEAALACYQDAGNRAGEGTALHNIGGMYETQGRYEEALDKYEAALACYQEVGDRAWEGIALHNIGMVYNILGSYEEALDQFEAALAITREMGDRAGEGSTLNNIGAVYNAQGRYEEALAQFEAALACYQEVGDWVEEGRILHNIGTAHHYLGHHEEALAQFEAALTARRQVDDRVGEGSTLHSIGMVYKSQGRYEEALTTYEQALVIVREVGDRAGEEAILNSIEAAYEAQGHLGEVWATPTDNQAAEGITLVNTGNAYYAQGRYEEALTVYEEALVILREVGDQAEEGRTLNNIGEVYEAQGRYGEAQVKYEAALVILREVGDRTGEGATLNNIGLLHHYQGRYEEALAQFEAVLTIAREVGDRTWEGTIFNNMGLVYAAQGRHEEALVQYEAALAIHREVGDWAGEGTALNNIGAVHSAQGRYEEALAQYETALAIARKVGDQDGEGTALNNIGVVYNAQGRYEEALAQYEAALTIRREMGHRAGEATALHNIGTVHHYLGRYGEALAQYEAALVIRREVGARAEEGATLNNIGLLHHHQGRYGEALAQFEAALAIHREVSARAEEGITLNNIGSVYNAQGRYEDALAQFEAALAIRREVGDRAGEGSTLNNIGEVYRAQERYEEALAQFEAALAARRETSDRVGEGATLNNMGLVYDAQGRYEEALARCEAALVILREVGDRAMEGRILTNIGEMHHFQGRYEESLVYYQQAMEIVEAARVTAGSEQGRAAFIARWAHLYTRAIGLYHQQGQDEAAFLTSERGRARAFLDAMATGYVQLSDTVAADLLAREQAAHVARQATQDALSRARAQQPPDATLIADLEAQLAAAEEEHAAALTEIEERHDQLAALVPGRSAVLDLSQIQALLDDQTTLLSFWVLQDQTLAFVVTREGLHTVALPVSQADLEAQITDFRSFPNLDIAHPESAVTLYAGLIAPLKDHLTTPHLVIVPHNVLHYLPFAALTDGQCYLVDDYTLTYLPNASVLPFIRQNADRAGGTPLILGNPATGDFDTAASLAAERDQLRPLPFAEQEARAIAALYATTALIRTAATESIVRQQAGELGILHLAAHGYYNPVAPLNSLIALAPDTANDGWLTAGEVYGLDLQQADLVVLSACQTQLGHLSAGDELVGLSRAFIYVGTPSLVATLWSVDDESTRFLMERFYGYLQEGQGKASALRQAQLDTMEEYPSPFYWAPFTLIGDMGEVEEVRSTAVSNRTWLWIGGTALLLVIIGGGVWIWKRRI